MITKRINKFSYDLKHRVLKDTNEQLKLLKDDLINLRAIIDDYISEIDNTIKDYGEK